MGQGIAANATAAAASAEALGATGSSGGEELCSMQRPVRQWPQVKCSDALLHSTAPPKKLMAARHISYVRDQRH